MIIRFFKSAFRVLFQLSKKNILKLKLKLYFLSYYMYFQKLYIKHLLFVHHSELNKVADNKSSQLYIFNTYWLKTEEILEESDCQLVDWRSFSNIRFRCGISSSLPEDPTVLCLCLSFQPSACPPRPFQVAVFS